MYQIYGTNISLMNEIYISQSLYRVEFEVIEKVKELRKSKGWSQRTLSNKMGFSESFVGKVESLSQPEKYNLRHLIILKKIFSLTTLDDLFPKKLPNDDLIVIKYTKVPKLNKNGTASKKTEDHVEEILIVSDKLD